LPFPYIFNPSFCSLVAYNNPQIGALQSAANERCQAQDNVYIIEDNLYVMD
jgi:hypothetical protein